MLLVFARHGLGNIIIVTIANVYWCVMLGHAIAQAHDEKYVAHATCGDL
jgi:hypothetical protein